MQITPPFCVSATFGLILGSLMVPLASAQGQPAQQRTPAPNNNLKSIEVSDDHKVTFRILAPKADEVSVSGDFGQGGKLTRDDQGVWSITIGPLRPDYYTYNFNVDGVKTSDPRNPLIKPGLTGFDSVVFVSGDESDFETTKSVPHGEIRQAWYHSTTLDADRRLHVYTPPGYEGGSEKYPVFYLLHGAGDDDAGWSTIGRAGFILDNLIAAGKARPMLVVMPNGSLPRPTNLPRLEPGATPTPEQRALMESFQNRFTNELVNDVIPFVEKTYRVLTDREHRAIAGLSMGGGQTLQTLTMHPDKFAYVAIWSAGIFGGNAEQWVKRHEEFLGQSGKVNDSVKLLSISIGDKDFAMPAAKGMIETLKSHGFNHEVHISDGGHTWINWRRYLNDYAAKLFQ